MSLAINQWQQFVWMKQEQKIPHAILLSGDFDETLLFARMMARSLFCVQPGQEGYGCEKCKPCSLLLSHNHPDFIEVIPQEKETIKIDEIRSIQAKLSYSANQNSWKVVIIAKAELMTLNAANAVLKILEEPPAHTVFILTASVLSKIPATVRSRCEKWHFAKNIENSASDEQEKLLLELVDYTANKVSFYELSQRWAKQDLSALCRFLFACVIDLVRLTYLSDKSTAYFGKKMDELLYLHKTISPMKLFSFYDKLNGIWFDNQQVNNLNTQLVIENILLNWNK